MATLDKDPVRPVPTQAQAGTIGGGPGLAVDPATNQPQGNQPTVAAGDAPGWGRLVAFKRTPENSDFDNSGNPWPAQAGAPAAGAAPLTALNPAIQAQNERELNRTGTANNTSIQDVINKNIYPQAATAADPTGPTSSSWTSNTNVADLAQKSNFPSGSGVASFQNKDGSVSNTLLTGADKPSVPDMGNAPGIAMDKKFADLYDQRQKDEAAWKASLPDYNPSSKNDEINNTLKSLASRGPHSAQMAARMMTDLAINGNNNQTQLATNANSNATALQGHQIANQPAMAKLNQDAPLTLEDLKTKQFANAGAKQLQDTQNAYLNAKTPEEQASALKSLRGLQGKEPTLKVVSNKKVNPATGFPEETNYGYDETSGQITNIEEQARAQKEAQTVADLRKAGPQPQHVTQLQSLLKAAKPGSPEFQKHISDFDRIFGQGAAAKILSGK